MRGACTEPGLLAIQLGATSIDAHRKMFRAQEHMLGMSYISLLILRIWFTEPDRLDLESLDFALSAYLRFKQKRN